MGKSTKYEIESKRLAEVAEIAIEMVPLMHSLSPSEKEWYLKCYKDLRSKILFPEKQFRNLTSLKYIQETIFNTVNNTGGAHLEKFWKLIEEKNLGYVRESIENMFEKIAKKKRLNEHDYEFLTDNIVEAEQTGKITAEQAIYFKNLIGKHESSF
jgi:hypothetical protein